MATVPAAPGADPADQLQLIRRSCAALRARLPQACWDLAVVETTAGMALERGCRPADATVIRSRLADLANAVSALSEELGAIADAAERL